MPNSVVRWFSRRDIKREDAVLAKAEAASGVEQTSEAEIRRIRLEILGKVYSPGGEGNAAWFYGELGSLIEELSQLEGWKLR